MQTVKNPNKGQILVITLIIMFIVSLVALSAAIGINRDTQQRVFNEIYEQNYFAAESRILQASEQLKDLGELNSANLPQFQDGFDRLSDISTDFSSSCEETQIGEFQCVVTEDCIETTLDVGLQNSDLDEITLNSEDAIHIDLTDENNLVYDGDIDLSWTGNVKWSMGVVYSDGTYRDLYPDGNDQGSYEVIKAVYNSAAQGGTGFNFQNNSSNSVTIRNLSETIENLTSSCQPRRRTSQIFIPSSSNGSCSYPFRFNDRRHEHDIQGVTTRGARLTAPGGGYLCSIESLTSSGRYRYDDEMLMTVENVALFSSNSSIWARLPIIGGMRRYTSFRNVYGVRAAPGGSAGAGRLRLPSSDSSGSISFTLSRNYKNGISAQIADQRFVSFRVRAFGNNDPNADCRSERIRLNVTYTYVPSECSCFGVRADVAYLRLRPIVLDGEVTQLKINADSDLPTQVASVTAQAKNTCSGDTSPTPLLQLSVPLIDAPPAMFDYVYFER